MKPASPTSQPTESLLSRRDLSRMLPALLGMASLNAAGIALPAAAAQPPTPLTPLVPGKYEMKPTHSAPGSPRQSRSYLLGLLPGNLRLEAHFTHLAPGCPPEPVEHHLHSEMWCVHEGAVKLMSAGKTEILHAGDFGLVPAGTEHSIYNASATEAASYFVLAIGPPE